MGKLSVQENMPSSWKENKVKRRDVYKLCVRHSSYWVKFPYNDTFKSVCGWAYSDTDLCYFSPSLHAVYKVGHCWQLYSLKWLLLKKLWNHLAKNRYRNIFTESDILATIISSINRHALDRGLCQTVTGITHEILLIVNGNNVQCPFKSPGLTPGPWVPDPESWVWTSWVQLYYLFCYWSNWSYLPNNSAVVCCQQSYLGITKR